MGSAHTQPRGGVGSDIHSELDRARCVAACAPLSRSHPSPLQNQNADVPAQTSASASTSATIVSASVPLSTVHPNAATFLRLAAMERQLVSKRSISECVHMHKPIGGASPTLIAPPATPVLQPQSQSQSQPQSTRREKRSSLPKSNKARQHRLSLFPCDNCGRLCQPDVLSKDKKVYCSGECYFSAAFRGEQQNFHRLYNEVLWDDMELEADHQSQAELNCCDGAEDGDEYLLACKRRARHLQENEKTQPAARPSLVLATQPIRIPLPHPDYVPY